MNTFLIISSDKDRRDQQLQKLLKKYTIDPLDVIILENEGSIGIEDIRNFQKRLSLKPFKGAEKAAVIANAERLTIEAQNALLKTLEEPPDNTYIFLSAETDNNFLPTILSRSSSIVLQENKQVSQESLEKVSQELEILLSGSIGDKLKQAEVLAGNKQNALDWLEQSMFALREKLLENPNEHTVVILENLQQTYTMLKTTNVNIRFSFENLFLKF